MPVAKAQPTLHRRSSAAAVALLVLLGGALTGCGFDYQTNRVNTIAAGVADRDTDVDALGIRVLSSEAGEGRLIGALANNTKAEAGLRAVSGEGITVEGLEDDIVVPPTDLVNLAAADSPNVQLTGDFAAGDVIPLDFTVFSDTVETFTLHVPVVKLCHQYTQVPEAGSTGDAHAEDDTTEHTDDERTADEHTGDARYICDHPTPGAGSGH